ncbi:unnamed protein product [Malus baccata var. baccata]
MAVMELEEPKKRKRRTHNRRKLLVGAQVEVRSVEAGFQGSWHPGIVIACNKQGHRQVQYEHLLCDDESGNLVDVVSVSPILDGIGSFTGNGSNYRGCIRPTPPHIQPGEWDLPYGLCVDVFHEDGWWEGVIFDHEDGSEERRIFFPDLGDELNARIDTIRITHDWDEVTENWKRRGTWVLLELLEKYDNERYIAVSVKQIWYDVREKKGFENVKEWTSPMRHLWEELVLEVIDDNISITVDELLGVLDKSGCLSLETQVELESAHLSSDANMNCKENMVDSSAIVPVHNPLYRDPLVGHEDTFKNVMNCVLNCNAEFIDEQDVDGGLSINPDSACAQQVHEKSYMAKLISAAGDDIPDMNSLECSNIFFQNKEVSVLPQVLSAFPSNLDGNSCVNSGIRNGGIRSFNSRSKSTLNWLPFDPQAIYCPESVDEYLNKRSNFKVTAVRQHLQYLGWKMEFAIDKGCYRYRYLCPDGGEYEYSLFQVCKKLKKPKRDTLSISEDATQGLHCSEEQTLLIEQPQESHHPSYCPQMSGCSYHEEFIYKPEYCHEAVVEYYNHAMAKGPKKKVRKMVSKAKKHLSAVGWVFLYASRKSKNLCYKSPKGVVHFTLYSACKSCMDGDFVERPAECMYVIEEDEGQSTRNRICSTASNLVNHEGLVPSKTLSKNWSRDAVSMSQASNLVEIGNVKVHGSRKCPKKRKYGPTELIGDEKLRCLKDQCANPPKLKRRKGSGALDGLRDELGGSQPTRVLRSSKRVQEATSSHKNPRNVLSWLIDNNMVSPREKVNYRSTKDSHPMKQGKITREGIRCSCCTEVYTLSSFGHHAGSSNHRPYANIFLEDGRSLLDCQVQIMHERRERNFRKQPRDRMKGNWRRGENDYICTVCHFGGDLILCDQCPSSFHKKCLGLKAVPDGDWFCSSCRCGICGQMNFKEEKESIVDDNCVLTCGQCEHKYHKGCLRKRGAEENESDPEGNWYCSKSCKKISFNLDERLGKQIPVGDDNLSWSLLKFNKCDTHATDEHDTDDALTECYSKLNVALDVMHECFVPVKEPLTRRDLVEDVIFSRGSDLNRLNFRGFYTVLLERNDELITAATVRIFGDKVAELPLVATRFQYRRLGMCRILMDELEKMLMELGVERLVLPAVPSVLNTWTTSFGFSKMTPSERLKFLDYTFLDFQGTIMCQKLLMKNAPAEARPLKRTVLDLYGDICGSRDNTDVDMSITVSEVYQAEPIEDGRIACQGVENAAGNKSRPCAGETNPEFSSVEDADCNKESRKYYKQYKRRRISTKGIQVMLNHLTLHDQNKCGQLCSV